MLHAMGAANRPVSDKVMRGMFAARKQVFVDLLKWDVPVLGGAYEIDQFDDAHAHYLVLADRDGGHLGSARLLPTTRPHILDSFYPELCEAAPPSGPDIFEVTRFCLDRSLSARERRGVRDTLVTALADHALAHGIARYSAIAEMGWLQQILAFGWRCCPLGLPVTIGGKMLGALAIEIEPDTPRKLAAAGIVPLPALLGGDTLAAA
ncbi:GNAT family N-acetyltransferase [Sphingomonas koreensis]|jgi:N-acyl-L-homoserine lactone synthetase|uniref:Acyl-homoserine-lactone synthase n=1 Tax=Sphingomonas koreensis TaxID=93064 RepID=A0A1L6JFA5_9SPHN|nr:MULTISPECIES: acyl-homoserine-lactone synthase [Sphingomonas]APR54606.1 autoinducer synthase [Sphingomonas koreensis]MDK2769257.1 GNAT family N-acetyltransferase [Sphingomonas sp.]PJI89732.1 acyl-homoserine lactone synthase [Sphingomonas koreensis]RSU20426.1 GNAT family N-acetyltransferase [Sphingomonas koreensis]RSU28878.1 GNAT family N-acetyltransferase [Sphingomonas koreensis]